MLWGLALWSMTRQLSGNSRLLVKAQQRHRVVPRVIAQDRLAAQHRAIGRQHHKIEFGFDRRAQCRPSRNCRTAP